MNIHSVHDTYALALAFLLAVDAPRQMLSDNSEPSYLNSFSVLEALHKYISSHHDKNYDTEINSNSIAVIDLNAESLSDNQSRQRFALFNVVLTNYLPGISNIEKMIDSERQEFRGAMYRIAIDPDTKICNQSISSVWDLSIIQDTFAKHKLFIKSKDVTNRAVLYISTPMLVESGTYAEFYRVSIIGERLIPLSPAAQWVVTCGLEAARNEE